MDEDAVTGLHGRHVIGDGDDHAHGLVPEDHGRLPRDVPWQGIGAAEAARLDANHRLARTGRGHRHRFQPDVAPGMEHGGARTRGKIPSHGSTATLMARLERASPRASSSRASGTRWVTSGSMRTEPERSNAKASCTSRRP